MALSPSGSGRLKVLQAVEEGWAAFCRAPWAFLLFQVLASLILLPFVLLAAVGAGRLTAMQDLMGVHPTGAWLALEGRKPVFADFTRWDRGAAGRLLGAMLLLVVVALAACVIAAVVGSGLGKLNQILSAIPAIVVGIFLVWLAITQKFLVQVSLLGGRRPVESLRSGVHVVNPSWWTVLWLGLVEGVIHAIAALFNYGGLVVVMPLILCITTAAYRQLFGPEDRSGLVGGQLNG